VVGDQEDRRTIVEVDQAEQVEEPAELLGGDARFSQVEVVPPAGGDRVLRGASPPQRRHRLVRGRSASAGVRGAPDGRVRAVRLDRVQEREDRAAAASAVDEPLA
jgi:hypothetical protein